MVVRMGPVANISALFVGLAVLAALPRFQPAWSLRVDCQESSGNFGLDVVADKLSILFKEKQEEKWQH